jgi:ABC-type multidrug transport system fused ATPase/permease subunit
LLAHGSSRPRTCAFSSLHNEGEAAGHGYFGGIQSGKYLLGGIQKDLERRFPHYMSDFRDGFHPKAASSVLFLYFACLAPCIAFGGLMSHVTHGDIGVVETLVGTSGPQIPLLSLFFFVLILFLLGLIHGKMALLMDGMMCDMI